METYDGFLDVGAVQARYTEFETKLKEISERTKKEQENMDRAIRTISTEKTQKRHQKMQDTIQLYYMKEMLVTLLRNGFTKSEICKELLSMMKRISTFIDEEKGGMKEDVC